MAKLGLAVVAAGLLLDCVALVVDIIAGRRIVSGTPVDEVGLDFSSTLSKAANAAVPLGVLVGGALFVSWFWCAYQRRAEAAGSRFAPIWAVIGWLVPGLNLIRPPQIMNELSNRRSQVSTWWGLWLVGAAVQFVLRFITPETQPGWIRWQSTALVANLVLLASLALAFMLVAATTNAARQR